MKELAVAEMACIEAGKIAMKYFRKRFSINYKAPRNPVTQVDIECEQRIKKLISGHFPEHSFLGEEEGKQGNSDFVWLIDPIDGTTNFLHGVDYFCVTVALAKANEVLCGVVYNPMHKKLFSAAKGKGAFLNKKKLVVSKIDKLENSLVVSGFPYNAPELERKTLQSTANLRGKCQDIRRFGSAALDLCSVAQGTMDAYFEYQLNPWDVAAGILIVREAGGKVTDINGKEATINSGHYAASNGFLHEEVLSNLERV